MLLSWTVRRLKWNNLWKESQDLQLLMHVTAKVFAPMPPIKQDSLLQLSTIKGVITHVLLKINRRSRNSLTKHLTKRTESFPQGRLFCHQNPPSCNQKWEKVPKKSCKKKLILFRRWLKPKKNSKIRLKTLKSKLPNHKSRLNK